MFATTLYESSIGNGATYSFSVVEHSNGLVRIVGHSADMDFEMYRGTLEGARDYYRCKLMADDNRY